jgi:hypothetical protein
MTQHQDHPLQPIYTDEHGTIRFKNNPLVEWILKQAGGLNAVASRCPGKGEDYDQLLQLIGYSVSGAPLSEKCRARVDEVEDSKQPSFSSGYEAGKRDTLHRIQEVIVEIGEE